MDAWSTFFGPNAGYAQELYERYLQDPASVDAETRAFFDRASPPPPPDVTIGIAPPSPLRGRGARQAPQPPSEGITEDEIRLAVGTAKLARMIRTYGHLAAHLDPLDTPPQGNRALCPRRAWAERGRFGKSPGEHRLAQRRYTWRAQRPRGHRACLRAIYSGTLGYDFDHVQDEDERAWLHESVESGTFRQPLDR